MVVLGRQQLFTENTLTVILPLLRKPQARMFINVARLWAIQKIDFLIDEIRERGASKELVDHIVEVAKRYGIVTPYTSALMTEDTPTGQVLHQLKASQTAKFSGRKWGAPACRLCLRRSWSNSIRSSGPRVARCRRS